MSHRQVAEVPPKQTRVPKPRICIICPHTLTALHKEPWCFRHTESELKSKQVRIRIRRRKQMGRPAQKILRQSLLRPVAKSGRQPQIEKVIRVRYMPAIRKMIPLVRTHFNLPHTKFLRARTREPKFVKARYVLMYLLYKDTELTMVNVGKLLGGMNYATVLYGVRKITKQLLSDVALQETLGDIRSMY